MRQVAIVIIFGLIIIPSSGYTQELYWGFEDWELTDSIEYPIGWNINHQTFDYRVPRFFKDSVDVVEGNYSLKAVKDDSIITAWSDCESRASVYQELPQPLASNQSIYFSTKMESLNEFDEAYLQLRVGFSENNDFMGKVEYLTYEEMLDWTEIEIPIPYEGATSMSIRINAASQNGFLDGCNFNSIVWLDDLRIEQSTVNYIDTKASLEVNTFPNPANGIVYLSPSDKADISYEVFDPIVRLLSKGDVINESIPLTYVGLNIIYLQSETHAPLVLKVYNLGL